MHSRNNRQQHRSPRPASASFSVSQIEIARTEDGSRRLFRCKLNGELSGFVEKHFKGSAIIREFAHGGPRNDVDEAAAIARFNGVEAKPIAVAKPAPAKAKASTAADLPAFITNSEPMKPGKSAKPKARQAPPPKVVSAKKPSGERRTDHKPLTRKQGLELAGSLLKGR